MKFTFQETPQENDAFQFGGELTICAENAQEVESVVSHFKLFADVSDVDTLKARIQALESGTYSHTMKSAKRPVYGVDACLDYEFTAPYKEWALRCFGYDGVFPDLTIPRKWGGLQYTNYKSRLFTENEHICFEAFTTSEPWNGKDAQTYAESCVLDSIGEEFGTRYHEPEFIQAGNRNHMKQNPDYLRRHPSKPQASNARLKRAFFEWWLTTHANAAQKEVVQGNADIVAETGDYMSAFLFEKYESHIYWGHIPNTDGKRSNYKSLSFPEFAALES